MVDNIVIYPLFTKAVEDPGFSSIYLSGRRKRNYYHP